ncbi:hypothetical protein DFH09DRAFT_1096109 [Mycena vulgaris]|nr:hypothetical protein DFH09DRAFT_1096109 [Mycena vulgaris]
MSFAQSIHVRPGPMKRQPTKCFRSWTRSTIDVLGGTPKVNDVQTKTVPTPRRATRRISQPAPNTDGIALPDSILPKHQFVLVLTGERYHDECFVCDPTGNHYQPWLPAYPEEWDYLIDNRKTAPLSRNLDQLFCLTALGVYDGDFRKFPSGVSAVTLNRGQTYHRILPAHEGQHAVRWFIHNPLAMLAKGSDLEIPFHWINSALAGLERVNPFISELENLNVYDDDDDIALHLQYSDAGSSSDTAGKVVHHKINDTMVIVDKITILSY